MRTWTVTIAERENADIEDAVLRTARELATLIGARAVAVTKDDFFEGRVVVYNHDGVGACST